MATPVKLPALGESVTEGTVTRWLKQVGDSVEVDEALLEVSTDKVDTEIPSPVAGTLLEIKVDEDETVEVGAELAVVGDESESSGESAGSDESGADESDADESGADESDADEEAAASDEASGDEGSSDKAPSDSQNEAPSDEAPTDDDSSADKNTDEGEEKQVPEEPPKAGAEESSGEGTSVTLPELGESVTEGTVTRWLKQVGDSVEVDEALLEVSTDKVDTEIPSPVAGTLLEIKVEEDETVEVGAELAVVGSGEAGGGSGSGAGSADGAEQADAAEEKPEPEPEAKDEPDEGKGESAAAADEGEPPTAEPSGDEPSAKDTPDDQAKARGQQQDAESPEPASPGGGSYVTPLVRKLAAQHDVDLSGVEGTGVGGRIRKQDVLAAAEQAQQAQQAPAEEPAADEKPAADKQAPAAAVEVSPLRGTTEKMTRLRKTIAKRMVESLQVSAQLTTVVEVDVTAIGRLRGRVKDQFLEREGVKLSFLPFFAKATIDCLKAHPRLNASIDTDAGEVTYHGSENLGVAVDTERGLLVPVIKDAGDLSIAGLSRKIADLASRTRDNKVSPDELSGGTFTLTNTGSRGALFDTPIINQPQVGILGTGSVVKRPVVIDDPDLGETIALRQMAYLALSYDHRIVDGADAARFLTAVKARLEEANFEAELGF